MEEDEEDEEEEPGFDALVRETEARESAHELERHRDLYNKLEQDDDVANLADYFKQRYSKHNEMNQFGSSDQLSGTIIQQKLLPGVRYDCFLA